LGTAGSTVAAIDTQQAVKAGSPSNLSVTAYRSPQRGEGSLDLDTLGGFALIRETRTIQIPAGETRLRFEGVADGIEPATAILSGLPVGVIEKNLDAELLSPQALVARSVGKSVVLVRTHAKTGRVEQIPGTLLSDNDGVLFQTRAGVEALRCSGLAETFSFSSAVGLSAVPTLSVLVRTPEPVNTIVTLSYLAHGFDWAANYTATLSPDRKTLDLGAWVTLANGNGVSFPAAHVQVVAGRVNRADAADDALAGQEWVSTTGFSTEPAVLANCWPRGSTSDTVPAVLVISAQPLGSDRLDMYGGVVPAALMESVVTARQRVIQEQLGDLKLYRVPALTDFLSRQSKQVRLLDRSAIPVASVYSVKDPESAGHSPGASDPLLYQPATMLLRTKNDAAHHLGLPLPSGMVAAFAVRDGNRLLLEESGMRDLAVNEEVEIGIGVSPDVQVRAVREATHTQFDHAPAVPLVPGVLSVKQLQIDDVLRVEVHNARTAAIQFELPVLLAGDTRIIRADHSFAIRKGRPLFALTVPAHSTAILRYQTARSELRPTQPDEAQ